MSSPKYPTKAERRASARDKIEQVRKEHDQRARRNKIIAAITSLVVVLAAIVGIAIAIQVDRNNDRISKTGPALAAANQSAQGGVTLGNTAAPVTVTQFFDFMCPGCGQFEAANSAHLDELRNKGEIKIEYVPLSFLDRYSNGTNYSSRAASAAYCVAESAVDKFSEYTKVLFANQPQENTEGLTTDQLKEYAKNIGINEAGTNCIGEEKYFKYANHVAERASKEAKVEATPTIWVNGKEVGSSSESLNKAIADAQAAAGVTPAPEATPSPAVSGTSASGAPASGASTPATTAPASLQTTP